MSESGPPEPPRDIGYIDPSFPRPEGDAYSPIIIYGYTPSLVLAILALVLYGIFLLTFIFRFFYSPGRGSRTFSTLILIGIVFELIGYIFRVQSTAPPVGQPYKTINFIIQYFFIVVAPVFFSAGDYTILTSMMKIFGGETQRFLHLPRKAIIGIFVGCDVVATIVQVAGAALIGVAKSNREDATTPNNILLAGLAFQVVSYSAFLILFFTFLTQNKRRISTLPNRSRYASRVGGFKAFLAFTSAASFLIYTRTIFRMAETAEGIGGYAQTHESLYGVFEFAPVVLAVVFFVVWHPGFWVGGKNQKVEEEGFRAQDGTKEEVHGFYGVEAK